MVNRKLIEFYNFQKNNSYQFFKHLKKTNKKNFKCLNIILKEEKILTFFLKKKKIN